MQEAKLRNVLEFPRCCWFEGLMGPQRVRETWHCKKPEDAIGEGATLCEVEAAGLKGSWRGVDAWHHMAESEALNIVQKRPLVNVQPSCSRD